MTGPGSFEGGPIADTRLSAGWGAGGPMLILPFTGCQPPALCCRTPPPPPSGKACRSAPAALPPAALRPHCPQPACPPAPPSCGASAVWLRPFVVHFVAVGFSPCPSCVFLITQPAVACFRTGTEQSVQCSTGVHRFLSHARSLRERSGLLVSLFVQLHRRPDIDRSVEAPSENNPVSPATQ